MPADNLEIANRALVLLGEEKIASLAGTDDTSIIANGLYEPLIVSLFGKFKWRFARTRVALVAGSAPINQWSGSFDLPVLNTDRVGAPLAFYSTDSLNAAPTTDYELIGARVETNHTALWCLYTKRQDETLWPETFARFAAHAFAAEIAEPITQQKTLTDRFKLLAFGTESDHFRGGMFREAMQEDRASDPDQSLLDYTDPILLSRWG